MKKKLISTVVAAAMTASMVTGCVITPIVETASTTEGTVFDVSSIRAQDDFFGYCNAEYLLNSELDAYSGTAGAFDEVNRIVDEQLAGIIRDIANGDRSTYLPGSNEQLIYDLYWQSYDYTTGGVDSSETISSVLLGNIDRINSCSSYDDLFDVMKDVTLECGSPLLFETRITYSADDPTQNLFYVFPETLRMHGDFADVSMGLNEAEHIRNNIRDCLYYSGVDYEEADSRAMDLTYLLIDLSANTNCDISDYVNSFANLRIMSEEEIEAALTNMSIENIYSVFGISDNPSGTLALCDVDQLVYLDSLMTDENLRAIKDLVIYEYMGVYKMILPDDMGGSYTLYSDDTGAIEVIKNYLDIELGEEYAEHYMDPEVVEDVTSIAEDIVDEYINMVNSTDWMEDETKEAIVMKLNNIAFFIGAGEPHEIDPDDALLIGDNIFETLTNIQGRSWRDKLHSITVPAERNGFLTMPPQMVNAIYNPSINTVNISLAIMNGQVYSPDRSYAANLGAIGVVIGHEISHAFDSTGMNFDYQGRYSPDWICEDDREDFALLSQEFIDYYSEFVVMDVYHVNGEQTLGENLADASAVQCVLNIVTDDDGRREIFESYARICASVTTDTNAIMALETDEHSPERVRVNAVVAMFDCFYELYDVQEGDLMYIAPEDRVSRW